MNRQARTIAWMVPAIFLCAVLVGCAFRDQAAFRQRVEHMSDDEVIATYRGITQRLKAIDKEIRQDRDEVPNRSVKDPATDMNAYFSSGYVDLYAKEKILIREIRKRRLHP